MEKCTEWMWKCSPFTVGITTSLRTTWRMVSRDPTCRERLKVSLLMVHLWLMEGKVKSCSHPNISHVTCAQGQRHSVQMGKKLDHSAHLCHDLLAPQLSSLRTSCDFYFFWTMTHLFRVSFAPNLMPVRNSRALTLVSCKEFQMRTHFCFPQTTTLLICYSSGVTHQVEDKERGQRGVGLDGVSCHRAVDLNCHLVGVKTNNWIWWRFHQQFHHQTREAPANLKTDGHLGTLYDKMMGSCDPMAAIRT